MATPFTCSYNIFYIYQAFSLLFHKALHPPSLFLSLSVNLSLSLSLSVVPHSVFKLVVFPCGLEMLMLSSCNPKFFAVRHIHYPSSDHCHTETVLPPTDHYCIETVAPSGDHYCIDIVVPSSDHCCTVAVSPSSDYY